MDKYKLRKLIPSALALTMGIASILLLLLNKSPDTIIPLLAIGVACLGFVGINNL